MIKKILIGLIIVFILIQFLPVDRSNPPSKVTVNWDSPKTQQIFYKACADCHTNETNWPFYSYFAPVSWMVANHVWEGREKFNISTNNMDEAGESAKLVRNGEMPFNSYLMMHSEAKLSEADKNLFIQGLINTFGEEEDETEK